MNDTQLLERLSAFVSDHKRALFDRIAPLRTRHVTVVLEDVYQSHNASAVVRTCDLLGVQDLHVIEQRNAYKVDRNITLGSSQWVDVHHHNDPDDARRKCIDMLRARGYRIIATSPRAEQITPSTIALQQPMAFCFGTELEGISDELLGMADEHLRIPMYGFTESYNLSVSAAIVLYTVMERLRASEVPWNLGEDEITAIKLAWTRGVVHRADLIEQRLRAEDDHASTA